MHIKTNKNNYSYILSNNNIFESVKNRVFADNYGCTVFLPHVCNNIDLFGAGFAASIETEYPSVKQDYHLLGKNFLRSNMGHIQVLKVAEEKKYKHKLYIVNMIAQNGIKGPKNLRPLNYLGLVKCMNSLSTYIQMHTGFNKGEEKVEIHCPKFGSGLAGGNWNFISDLIEDIWSKYPVIVYNYDNKTNKT